jgi:hypothetical protein
MMTASPSCTVVIEGSARPDHHASDGGGFAIVYSSLVFILRNTKNKNKNMDESSVLEEQSDEVAMFDGLLAVVAQDCVPEPTPELDKYRTLVTDLIATTTWMAALDVMENAHLTPRELDRLNCRMFDGLNVCVYERIHEHNLHTPDWTRRELTFRDLVYDAPVIVQARVYSGVIEKLVASRNVPLMRFMTRRGIDLRHRADVMRLAIKSNAEEVVEFVYLLSGPNPSHHHIWMQQAVTFRSTKIMVWLVQKGLCDLKDVHDALERYYGFGCPAAIETAIQLGAMIPATALHGSGPPTVMHPLIRLANAKGLIPHGEFGRGTIMSSILMDNGFIPNELDLAEALRASDGESVRVMCERFGLRPTKEQFVTAVRQLNFGMVQLLMREGRIDGKEVVREGLLARNIRPEQWRRDVWENMMDAVEGIPARERTIVRSPVSTRSKSKRRRE